MAVKIPASSFVAVKPPGGVVQIPYSSSTTKVKSSITVVSVTPQSGAGVEISIPAGEPILRGQPIWITNEGTAIVAENECIGVALNSVSTGELCTYSSDGIVSRSNWASITGAVELEVGKTYYVSGSGGLSTTIPGFLMQVGIAISTERLDIELGRFVILSEG